MRPLSLQLYTANYWEPRSPLCLYFLPAEALLGSREFIGSCFEALSFYLFFSLILVVVSSVPNECPLCHVSRDRPPEENTHLEKTIFKDGAE